MALVTKTLPDLFDFTRASGGGYYDSTGKFVWGSSSNAPRITYDPLLLTKKGILLEGQRTNLRIASEVFDWSETTDVGAMAQTRYRIPNATVAPDGTTTAIKLVPSIDNDEQRIYTTTTGVTLNLPVTYSIFAKAGELTRIGLKTSSGASSTTIFDLVAGTVIQVGSATANTIDPVGNGWYRISITYTPAVSPVLWIQLVSNANTASSWTGDGVSGIYVWGAQLEQGATRTSYIPNPRTFVSRSTTATYRDSSGVLQTAAIDVARINYRWDGSAWVSAGLLVEPGRVNLLTQSGFANGLSDAPIRSGLITATTFTGFPGAIAFGHDGVTPSWAYKQYTTTAGTTYTFSFYIMMEDLGVPVWGTSNSDPTKDFAIITEGGASGMTGVVVTPLGAGLYRISGQRLATAAGTTFGVAKYAANSARTFKVTGYQLEQGPDRTSYIPTTTAQAARGSDIVSAPQVTRSADSLLLADTASASPTWSRDIGTWVIKIADAAKLKNVLVFNGYSVIADISGTGTVILVKKSRYEGDVYVDGVYAYTLNTYHGIDLNALTDLVIAEGGEGRGCVNRVRFFPRIMSQSEISDIGVA